MKINRKFKLNKSIQLPDKICSVEKKGKKIKKPKKYQINEKGLFECEQCD